MEAAVGRHLVRRWRAADQDARAIAPGPAPLSTAQRGVLVFERLHPGTAVFNLHHVARHAGALDPERLDTALSVVLRRHPALRSTFGEANGHGPVRTVHEWTTLRAGWTDLTHLPPDRRAAAVREEAGRLVAAPFDLAARPAASGARLPAGRRRAAARVRRAPPGVRRRLDAGAAHRARPRLPRRARRRAGRRRAEPRARAGPARSARPLADGPRRPARTGPADRPRAAGRPDVRGGLGAVDDRAGPRRGGRAAGPGGAGDAVHGPARGVPVPAGRAQWTGRLRGRVTRGRPVRAGPARRGRTPGRHRGPPGRPARPPDVPRPRPAGPGPLPGRLRPPWGGVRGPGRRAGARPQPRWCPVLRGTGVPQRDRQPDAGRRAARAGGGRPPRPALRRGPAPVAGARPAAGELGLPDRGLRAGDGGPDGRAAAHAAGAGPRRAGPAGRRPGHAHRHRPRPARDVGARPGPRRPTAQPARAVRAAGCPYASGGRRPRPAPDADLPRIGRARQPAGPSPARPGGQRRRRGRRPARPVRRPDRGHARHPQGWRGLPPTRPGLPGRTHRVHAQRLRGARPS